MTNYFKQFITYNFYIVEKFGKILHYNEIIFVKNQCMGK